MPLKIAFIGAGSFGFTRTLVRDILTQPRLADATLSLMDIDAERLAFIRRAVERIVREGGYAAKVESTMDRRKAVEGADAVLVTILVGGLSVWRHDIEIPKAFGVDINVGDTRGPSGIFRALRTIPVMLDIARDVERLAPRAILLNYTNPMAMLCRAMQRETRVKVTGLCHSVQGSAMMLARWIGAPFNEIEYLSAGLNHQSWYLTYRWNGEDAYPLIRRAVEREEVTTTTSYGTRCSATSAITSRNPAATTPSTTPGSVRDPTSSRSTARTARATTPGCTATI
jgi:alpha-galactosidase